MRFAITGHITVLSDIEGTDDNTIREKQTFVGSDFGPEEGGTRRDDEGATYHDGIWKAFG